MTETESARGSRTPSTGVAVAAISVAAHEEELRHIREVIAEVVTRHGGHRDVVADLQLAACELATNVIQHARSGTLRLELRRTGAAWELDVYDAEEVPELSEVAAPPLSSLSGRGLLVVTAVMDDVVVVVTDSGTAVRCTRRH